MQVCTHTHAEVSMGVYGVWCVVCGVWCVVGSVSVCERGMNIFVNVCMYVCVRAHASKFFMSAVTCEHVYIQTYLHAHAYPHTHTYKVYV